MANMLEIFALKFELHWLFWLGGLLSLIWIIILIYRQKNFKKTSFTAKNQNVSIVNPNLGGSNVLNHRIIMIGDSGALGSSSEPDMLLQILEQELRQTNPAKTVVLLGDNVYPKGLPPIGHKGREKAETQLNMQLDIFAKYVHVNLLMILGNHDWKKGRAGGYKYALRQEEYVHNYLNRKSIVLPPLACPDIIEKIINENLVILIINTQWWVQRGFTPIGADCGCLATSEEDILEQLNMLILKNLAKRIIIAGHHPLFSNALHGGKFTAKFHLFPLTAIHKSLLIPLPIAGSAYPLFRKYYGSREDISHPRYKRMRKKMLAILDKFQNLIYVAGHDHNLQYFCHAENHYLISGAGSKVDFVRKGAGALFAHAHRGFVCIDQFANSELWLSFVEPTLEGKENIAYTKKIEPVKLKD